MKLTLHRDYLGTDCTQGKLTCGDFMADTMERPWVPSPSSPCGTKGVSCVPPGTYRLVPHNSEAHPNTWALVSPALWVYHWDENVPTTQKGLARTLVLIHAANYASELRGCIAPGKGRFLEPSGRRMVTQSKIATGQLLALLPWGMDKEHLLEVT